MPQISGDHEERNYSIVGSIVSGLLAENLRNLYIREWNKLYPTTPWDDTSASGKRLSNMELSRPHAKKYLGTYESGNTRDWDCTVLFDAILFSNALGKSHLSEAEADAVDTLRKVRNEYAHNKSNRIPNSTFKHMIESIKATFSDLGLSTETLENTVNEAEDFRSFKVLQSYSKNYCTSVFEHLNHTLQSTYRFYILLKEEQFDATRRFFGGFGSWWFKREQKTHNYNTFVMTLDGENEDTMLDSFKDFAEHARCDEDIITGILKSSKTKADKILSLKAEVRSKVENWNSWLIMVTNVVDLKKTLRFLPQLGERGWEHGRIVIATSDVGAVPPDSEFSKSIYL